MVRREPFLRVSEPAHPQPAEEDVLQNPLEEWGPGGPEGGGVLRVENEIHVVPCASEAFDVSCTFHAVVITVEIIKLQTGHVKACQLIVTAYKPSQAHWQRRQHRKPIVEAPKRYETSG